jgi:hypothetical protein
MLALTSPTSGGLSVGIVRLRTTATEFSFFSFFFNLWMSDRNISPPVGIRSSGI